MDGIKKEDNDNSGMFNNQVCISHNLKESEGKENIDELESSKPNSLQAAWVKEKTVSWPTKPPRTCSSPLISIITICVPNHVSGHCSFHSSEDEVAGNFSSNA